jgi:hypothetical protein
MEAISSDAAPRRREGIRFPFQVQSGWVGVHIEKKFTRRPPRTRSTATANSLWRSKRRSGNDARLIQSGSPPSLDCHPTNPTIWPLATRRSMMAVADRPLSRPPATHKKRARPRRAKRRPTAPPALRSRFRRANRGCLGEATPLRAPAAVWHGGGRTRPGGASPAGSGLTVPSGPPRPEGTVRPMALPHGHVSRSPLTFPSMWHGTKAGNGSSRFRFKALKRKAPTANRRRNRRWNRRKQKSKPLASITPPTQRPHTPRSTARCAAPERLTALRRGGRVYLPPPPQMRGTASLAFVGLRTAEAPAPPVS